MIAIYVVAEEWPHRPIDGGEILKISMSLELLLKVLEVQWKVIVIINTPLIHTYSCVFQPCIYAGAEHTGIPDHPCPNCSAFI